MVFLNSSQVKRGRQRWCFLTHRRQPEARQAEPLRCDFIDLDLEISLEKTAMVCSCNCSLTAWSKANDDVSQLIVVHSEPPSVEHVQRRTEACSRARSLNKCRYVYKSAVLTSTGVPFVAEHMHRFIFFTF